MHRTALALSLIVCAASFVHARTWRKDVLEDIDNSINEIETEVTLAPDVFEVSALDDAETNSSVTEEATEDATEEVPVISSDGLFNLTDLDGFRDIINNTDLETSFNATSQVLEEIGGTIERFGGIFENFFTTLVGEENILAHNETNPTPEAAEEAIKKVVEEEAHAIEDDLFKIEKVANTIAQRVCTTSKNKEKNHVVEMNITKSIIKDEESANATGGIKFSFKISMSFGAFEEEEEAGEVVKKVGETRQSEKEGSAAVADSALASSSSKHNITKNEPEKLQLHEILNITDVQDLANFLNTSEEVTQVLNATNDILDHINEGFDAIGKLFEDLFETVGSPISTVQPLISVQAEGGPIINIPGLLGVNTNNTEGGLLAVAAGNTTSVMMPGLLSVQVGEKPHPAPNNDTLVSISANDDGAKISLNFGRNRRMARKRLL